MYYFLLTMIVYVFYTLYHSIDHILFASGGGGKYLQYCFLKKLLVLELIFEIKPEFLYNL